MEPAIVMAMYCSIYGQVLVPNLMACCLFPHPGISCHEIVQQDRPGLCVLQALSPNTDLHSIARRQVAISAPAISSP